MKTQTKTVTTVEVAPADVAGWVKSLGLSPEDAVVRMVRLPRMAGQMEVVWTVPRASFDAYVKAATSEMPASTSMEVVQGDPDVGARVSWQS